MKKDKDRVIAKIIVIKTLMEILEGGEFDEKEYQVFKDYFSDAGYKESLLEEIPLIAVLQTVCRDFGKLNLEEYWVDGLITED